MIIQVRTIILFANIAVFFLLAPIPARATTTGLPCSNPHIASANDIAAGFPTGSSVCPRDERTVLADESGPAKEFLKKRWRGEGDPECTIEKLDSKFAICAANLMKNIPNGFIYRAYTGPRLTSTPQASKEAHARGLALDISADQTIYDRIQKTASQLGLKFLTMHRGHVEATPACTNTQASPAKSKNISGQGGAPSAQFAETLRGNVRTWSSAPTQEWSNSNTEYDLGLSRSIPLLAPIGPLDNEGKPRGSANFESLGYSSAPPDTEVAIRAIESIAKGAQGSAIKPTPSFSSVPEDPTYLAPTRQTRTYTPPQELANTPNTSNSTFSVPTEISRSETPRLNPFIVLLTRLFALIKF